MQAGGWFFIITSWSVIIILFIYSMFRTLTSTKPDNETKNGTDTINQP